jgi:glutamate 5-kinase
LATESAGTPGRDALQRARRVVVKVGSRILADAALERSAAVATDIAALRAPPERREVVLVSSGAIALGRGVLGMARRPHDLPTLQAAAAVGQTRLMQNWERAFAAHGLHTAQVLLTHDDLGDRRRFLNARHALRAMLDAGVVPVVNENDTVAVDEIRYGDNDLLAALVCNLISADALVILTDVDGLHDQPPAQGGRRIPIVPDIDVDARVDPRWRTDAADPSGVGSGGMASKVQAARSAARHGVATAVVAGALPHVLRDTMAGADLGTLFVPSRARMSSRKHWLAYGARPAGRVIVDAGAHAAVARQGKSLLPAGIVAVEGAFDIGDIVSLVTEQGTEFARGLAGYGASDLRRLRGLQSTDIEATLGYKYLDEVIHRDDLVLL